MLTALLVFAQLALALERCEISLDLADACVAQCVLPEENASFNQPFNSFAAPAPRVVADWPLVPLDASTPRADRPLRAGRTLQILYCSYQN